MSSAIFRYEVPVDDRFHQFALMSDPYGAGLRQSLVMEFWALHTPGAPTVDRLFIAVGTGHPLPATFKRHWGFAYDLGGSMVWHLIEVR